jgi:hypothetical protein
MFCFVSSVTDPVVPVLHTAVHDRQMDLEAPSSPNILGEKRKMIKVVSQNFLKEINVYVPNMRRAMEQSPCQSGSRLAGREVPRLLWNPKANLCPQDSALGPILSQLNLVPCSHSI